MADNANSSSPQGKTCPPCRGTGRIVSHLGGSPSTITCPWCEGTGRVLSDHDAQAARRRPGPEPPDDAA